MSFILEMRVRNLAAVLSLTALAGCATMADGESQTITITTTPPGAACVIDQVGAPPGEHVDQISYTPSAIVVQRRNKPLKITCAYEGLPTAKLVQPSGVNPRASLNILNGVIIGTAIDSSSGALYRYPSTINIDLTYHPAPAPVAVGKGSGSVKAPTTLSTSAPAPSANAPANTVAPRAAVTPAALPPLPAAHK